MLSDLKLKTRGFAQVPDTVASREDVDDVVSDETKAILDAVASYSVVRPRYLTVSVTPTTYEVSLSTLVSGGWISDSYRVVRVYWPTGYQSKTLMPATQWRVYERDDAFWLRFLVDTPLSPVFVEFAAPHVVGEDVDTLSAFAPLDVDAVCHLAASNLLRLVANQKGQQYSSTLTADTAQAADQAKNYALRAKDELAVYQDHIDGRAKRTAGRVNWGYPRDAGDELFWRSRRFL